MEHHQPRIGILTHFNSYQAGYALSVGWHERARLLEYYDQDFEFLVNETCPPDLYPRQRSCLKSIPKDEDFDKRVRFFRKDYRRVLEPYDIIMTADLIYQGKGNFLAWNAAMRQANEDFKARGQHKYWLHWIHSAFNKPKRAPYPESLRFTPMENSTLVYMNESEKWGVAQQYGVPEEDVACVCNPKDFRSQMGFHDYAWQITKMLDIPNKQVVQIFPFCITRADAKGLNEVLHIHAALKRQGASIALILANANARAHAFQIQRKKELAERLGLAYGEDYIFTSDIVDQKGPLPRQAVMNLFSVANVFVFGSWREVCPNVLLEAKISGNLLVVNENLAPGVEFAGEDAILFKATAKIPGEPDARSGDRIKVRNGEDYYDKLARRILDRLPSREHVWEFGFERIWDTQLVPLLVHAVNHSGESCQTL